RISFKSNPEDKARKLLEALPDATGAKRANVLQRLKALVEKHATEYQKVAEKYSRPELIPDVWKRALAAVAAEPAPPPKRKKSPAVGGVRKITKKAQKRERIADASAAVKALPEPAPELDVPELVGTPE